MADYVNVEVKGGRQLEANLRAFGSDRIVGRICRAALQAGGRVVRPHAAANARAEGLGFQGRVPDGWGHESPRYGRIPRSIKVGRAYIPKANQDAYRVNVVARGQRGRGIYKNKAPHAHLIEYGFTTRKGYRTRPRPFLGPALATDAQSVTNMIRAVMAKRIDAEKFPQ